MADSEVSQGAEDEAPPPSADGVAAAPSVAAAAPVSPELPTASEPSGAPAEASPAEVSAEAPAEGAEPAAPTDGEATATDAAPTPSAEGGSPATAGAPGADAPKRKRKRKRKRKPASADGVEGAEAAEGAAPAAASGEKPKKKDTHVPFGHLFAAGRPKRHAFAVGEVVAGRVLRFEDGGIVVDLFGKALAVADEHEPRDVPLAPQLAPPPKAEETAEAAEPTAAPTADPASGGEPGQESAAAAEEPTVDASPDANPEPTDAPRVAAESGADSVDPEATPVEPAGAESVGSAVETEPSSATEPSQDAAVAPQQAADVAPAEEPEEAAAEASDADADESSAGAQAGSGRALPPAPVVPNEHPRLEAVDLGSIYRGRVGAVSESGHIALLNRNTDTKAVRARIEQYRAERRRVEGLVFGFNRGGFDIVVEGVRGFCPASAMSLHEVGDPNDFVGRKFQFLLPQGKSGGKDVVVSRRSILEREQRKKAKELVKTLKPGTNLTGRVSSVREFGVFVDIGGIEGLVHQSELSYTFATKPADVATVGDTVEVQVLRVGGDAPPPQGRGAKRERRDKRDKVTRVSLSMKALLPDPWDDHKDAIAEGTVQKGKVTRTTDFGAFVELAPGIEGLLHITELGRDLKHASQVLKDGEEMPVIVERADRSARRISLSRLSASELQDFQDGKLSDPTAAPKNLRSGAKISVQVDKVEQRGVHVRIAGAIGKRARGYIPGSESGLERGADLRKAFPLGEEVEIKVIGTDRDGGLRCSVKALRMDEERRAIKDYRREASKQGFGTFGDLLKAKLGGDSSD